MMNANEQLPYRSSPSTLDSWLPMFGILNINKPPGLTSRDVVNRVGRLVRPAKVGHAGTLDPLATGVLVVCVGPATRLIEYVQRMQKEYRATFQLGCTSPSDDTELEVTPLVSPPTPARDQIEQALPQFIGDIQQRPPLFSAIKIQGRKAYDLARAGENIELASRKVTIHKIEVIHYTYPELVLDVQCGSGTYIRSLGRDLAESLSTGAVMSALERTAIGKFCVEEAVSPNDLTLDKIRENLRPAIEAVENLPRVELSHAAQEEIRHGRTICCDLGKAEEAAAMNANGELIALLRPRANATWGPKAVLIVSP